MYKRDFIFIFSQKCAYVQVHIYIYIYLCKSMYMYTVPSLSFVSSYCIRETGFSHGMAWPQDLTVNTIDVVMILAESMISNDDARCYC